MIIDPGRHAEIQADLSSVMISDDDLCADCKFLQYCPGEKSLCELNWPGETDEDLYYVDCVRFVAIDKVNENWVLPKYP